MPLYEYECEACGHRVEIIQKFSDGPPDTCPKCSSGPFRRLLSSPAIQFKGTGWYVTDYAGKGKGGGGDSPSSKKSETAASDGSASSETKGDAKKADAPAAPATPAKD